MSWTAVDITLITSEEMETKAQPPDKWISQTGTRGGKSQNNLCWSFTVTFQNLIWLKITHINCQSFNKK